MEQFYTLLTDIGKAKIANATALQTKVKFTKLLVGDSNGSYYEPTETQTKLKNKVWEGGIGNISIDKDNPNWIILESVIPSSVGGFTIREIGIEDEEGDLVVIAKYPQTYKPKIEDGSTKDLIIKTILEVTNIDTITLKVDPTIVLTTKKDLIDSQKELENKIDKNFIRKQSKTTWQDINVNESMPSGNTPNLGLIRPKVTDELLLKPFNDNFTKLDEAINKSGYGVLHNLYNVSLDEITTSGTYIVQNLKNAPDIPYGNWRIYLVKCYVTDLVGNGRMYEIYSYGTGKQYLYDSVREKYSDIPCTSTVQDSEIYIDSINGNDLASGDKDNPVKTWKCAYSRIPKILTKPITIYFLSDIKSTIKISNISNSRDDYGVTSTFIQFYGNNHELGKLEISNCHVGGTSYGINIYKCKTKSDTTIVDSSPAYISQCEIEHIYCDYSIIRAQQNKVGQYEAVNNSYIYLKDHTDMDVLSGYGCVASFGSNIFVSGNHPQGSVSEKQESYGGKVEYEN